MRSKVLGLVLCVLACLPAGCRMTSEEQIRAAQAAVPILQQAVDEIAVKMEVARQGMLAMEARLADPNLAFGDKERALALLAEYRAELEKWLKLHDPTAAALVKVREVVDRGPEGMADITDILRMAAEAIQAVAPALGPQAGGWLQIVATILGALVVLFGGGGAVAVQKLRTTRTAFKEVVAGGEVFKETMKKAVQENQPVDAITAFKSAQANEQRSPATTPLVALARTKAA